MGKFSICDFLSPGLGKTHIGPTERRLLPVLHFSERRLDSTVCCLITLKKVASMVEGSQCCQLVGKKAVLVTDRIFHADNGLSLEPSKSGHSAVPVVWRPPGNTIMGSMILAPTPVRIFPKSS